MSLKTFIMSPEFSCQTSREDSVSNDTVINYLFQSSDTMSNTNSASWSFNMLNMLKLAGKIAIPVMDNDPRGFWLGCIGIRKDGVLVSARNGSIQHMFSKSLDPDLADKSCEYHAEGRALRKMDKGGVLYVSRVSRKDGSLTMARPCVLCQSKIKTQKIIKVYYTVNHNQYGIWYPEHDKDKVYTIR